MSRIARTAAAGTALAALLFLPACAVRNRGVTTGAAPSDPAASSEPAGGGPRSAGAGDVGPGAGAGSRAEGEIPPSDRWVRPPTDPPSTPTTRASGINVRVNQDSSGGDQNETVLAINPTNPLNLVGGANDYRTGSVKSGFYSSLDGGVTWTDGVLPENTYFFQGDPAVAFCADGSAVFVSLSFNGSFQPHGLFLYRSTDGGVTWPTKKTVLNRPLGFPFADKEWIGCDTTNSTYANRVYVSWTNFALGQTPILMKWSSNFGNSWSSELRVSDGNSTQGSVIAIGPSGEVYIAWSDQGGSRIGFDRSLNGGANWGTDVFPSSVVGIPGDPVFRRNSFPTMDADRTNGSRRGHIYIAWSDNRNGDPDILLVRSTNGGATWSAPVRVNDDALGNGADQWFPWLAVDPNGRVIVTFFDRRRSPGGRPYEIWGAISRDGGQTFDTNFLISEVASNGSLNGFIGDYSGLAASADRLYPLWTDLRAGTGETDIYTDRHPNTFAYDEVRNVRFLDEQTLTFDTQDARFGQNLQYDVASGRLLQLRQDGGFAGASCLQNDLEDPPLTDARLPADGDGFWYLVRADGPGGKGSYGDGTPARPNVRDPLDESLVTCP